MKTISRIYLYIVTLVLSLTIFSCDDYIAPEPNPNVKEFWVGGASFKMIPIKGGTFIMGATLEQIVDAEEDEMPEHSVTLSDYYIGQVEVNQKLWQAVMGSNPSKFKGDNLPVDNVSWNDCQKFVEKLNSLTKDSRPSGMVFRLPTEAEWEYSARGGSKSRGHKYSGSSNIDNVAWYDGNSSSKTHEVATKLPNELGLYDMSGNVCEWCSDWYGDYNGGSQSNPVGPSSGSKRVFRGGSYKGISKSCRVSNRCDSPGDMTNYGLRIVLANGVEPETPDEPTQPDNPNKTVFTVKGVSFEMVDVVGGSFTMGATSEQGGEVEDDETPTHKVTLSDYKIGKTEVTQELWQAVMGSNPSHFRGNKLPVEQVSWDDCQEFVKKLNSLTGQTFRLPTEAEWEYAARGGNKSRGYKFSGNNDIEGVAWYNGNSSSMTHDVATKSSNELGLYDMSGNVCEWCKDWYHEYSSESQTNPKGPSSGSGRVSRGGGWSNYSRHNRVSYRDCYFSGYKYKNLGLRLVLADDAEPETPEEPNEPYTPNKSSINVKGVSFEMIEVRGGSFTMGATSEQVSDAYSDEKPTHKVTLSDYMIGKTEVTQELWQAVMGSNPSNFIGNQLPVEMVSWNDCQEFIKKLNQLTGRNFRLPTEAEWEYAARGGQNTKGYKYSGSNDNGSVAWYESNSSKQTHAVASKSPNELGLYDMSGNVFEWCYDWYGSYNSDSQINPNGPSSGSDRVRRGGCWSNDSRHCRVSLRYYSSSDSRLINLGFRLALSAE